MPIEIKDVLYGVIDGIGKEKIRADITTSPDFASRKYCKEIVDKCMRIAGPEAGDDTLGKLCEALLHFMLTASMLPSDRKVTVNGIELDVVIPSVKSLTQDPAKTIIIQVVKGDDTGKIKQAESVQPAKENIWIISAKQVDSTYRNYTLSQTRFQYPSIISDIRLFLADKKVNSLKFFHS